MTQNNLITIVTMWNKDNELSRENLFQRHEKQTKKIRPKRPETDIKIILLIQHPYVLYIS